MRVSKGDHVLGWICGNEECGGVVPLRADSSKGQISARMLHQQEFELRCPKCTRKLPYDSDELQPLVMDGDADLP